MIFDSHAHLISPDRERYPPDPLSGELDETVFDEPMTAERLIADMDAQGVRRALAVQRGHVYGFDSSYVCDAAAAFPDRLAAVCSINGLKDDCGDQVRHWVGERGAVGVRMMEPFKGADPSWFAGDAARALWVAAADLDTTVCVHSFRWARKANLPALESLLKDFPSVRVVMDHFTNMDWTSGPPDYGVDDLLLRMSAFPRVATKFTGIPLRELSLKSIDAAAVVRRVVDVFGAERVMWGSDIAQTPGGYDVMVGWARASTRLLSDAERGEVLYGAADRAYGRAFSRAA